MTPAVCGALALAALGAGGIWDDGADAGARAVGCPSYPWDVSTHIGGRGACDRL